MISLWCSLSYTFYLLPVFTKTTGGTVVSRVYRLRIRDKKRTGSRYALEWIPWMHRLWARLQTGLLYSLIGRGNISRWNDYAKTQPSDAHSRAT